jgi:hypothetical protein
MNFFLDENLKRTLCESLSTIAPFIGFKHSSDVGLNGIEDEQLFHQVVDRGFDAIITDDRRQLIVPTELASLRKSGLHWITFKRSSVSGIPGLSADAATIISGFPHILKALEEAERPQRIRVLGVPRESTQRIKVQDL